MIQFNYETEFVLEDEERFSLWIDAVVSSEEMMLGEINYIFCDDQYLHKINLEYLNHDTLTDIISFDYTDGNVVSGDIFLSVERVAENAEDYNVSFMEELKRVVVHGVLHYCGFKDKSEEDAALMRQKEDEKLLMFHVEN